MSRLICKEKLWNIPGAASVILNTAGTIRDSDAPNSEDWEGCRFKWLGHQDSNLDSWNQNPESCRWTTAQEKSFFIVAGLIALNHTNLKVLGPQKRSKASERFRISCRYGSQIYWETPHVDSSAKSHVSTVNPS